MRVLFAHRRASRLGAGVILAALVLAACTPGAQVPSSSRPSSPLLRPPTAPSIAVNSSLRVTRAPIPFPFEENRGQVPADVAFLLRAGTLQAAFGVQGVRYTMVARSPIASTDEAPSLTTPPGIPLSVGPTRMYTIEQELVGARPVVPVGSQPAPTRVNYMKGPSEPWLTDVSTFYQLRREGAWNGVDVLYERDGTGVESTYVVAPGADPGQIQLTWHGATATLLEDGSLQLETQLGVIQETAPIAWQTRAGQAVPVSARWAASNVGDGQPVWGFSLGAYDPTLPLTIDPAVLVNATYLGGSGMDAATAIDVDSTGAAYIAGPTTSTAATFPTGGGFGALGAPGFDQTYNGGLDAFVAKLAPNGQSLIYVTYVGGSGDDSPESIAVDADGAAYVSGETSSTETTFPNGGGFGALGVPGFDQSYNGGTTDAFVFKLAPTGQSLVYVTYLGGSGADAAIDVTLDSNRAAYVAGFTTSSETTFPNGAGLAGLSLPGFDQTFNGVQDAFVVKLAPNGQSLAYASYVGGNANDSGLGIEVDSSGAAYLTGQTGSAETTFPNGSGLAPLGLPGFDQFYNGGANDAFVVKLNPSGTGLTYVTYLGGSGDEAAFGIALDGSGAAYLAGTTSSTESTFPNGAGLFALNVPGFDQSYNGGPFDAFVAKLAPTGQSLAYVSYVGGSGDDQGTDVAVDASGFAYVTGRTGSTQASFPNGGGFDTLAAPGFDQTYNGGVDGFVVQLSPTGEDLTSATYLGGNLDDHGNAIALDSNGIAYVAGEATSTETTFPNGSGLAALGVPGLDQTYNGGTSDGFVVKLGPTLTPTATLTPTPTITLTPTPTRTPFACGPRPTVGVNTVPVGGGRLQVTVTPNTAPATPNNRLYVLRLTIPANARVDVVNGPGDLVGQQDLPLGTGIQPIVFFVRRVAPGAITVTVLAVDSCGEWPSFVGGGPNAF